MAQLLIIDIAPVPPLPLICYEAYPIAHTTVGEFGECDIVVGLDTSMVDQLIEKSQDITDIALDLTEDRIRFQNADAYEKWFQKKRTPFALVHTGTNELMALAWVGPKQFPREETLDVWDTLAFRSYPPYRGSGFMTSFGRYVVQKYLEQNPTRRLWVSIDTENVASQALAGKLGFVPADNSEGDLSRITMIL